MVASDGVVVTTFVSAFLASTPGFGFCPLIGCFVTAISDLGPMAGFFAFAGLGSGFWEDTVLSFFAISGGRVAFGFCGGFSGCWLFGAEVTGCGLEGDVVFTLRVGAGFTVFAIIFLRTTLGFGGGADACSQLHKKVNKQINPAKFRVRTRYFFMIYRFVVSQDIYFFFFFFAFAFAFG